jgi:competence protein ComGC
MENGMKKQRGVSLLELMLVILIVVTMLIAATRFYQTTKENAQAQNALTMVHEIVDASYKWYEANPNFSTISFTQLIANGLLPESYSDDKRFNPWGGVVGIGPAANNDRFYITMSKVPADSCNRLKQELSQYGLTSCQAGVFKAEF